MSNCKVVNKNTCHIVEDEWLAVIVDIPSNTTQGCVRQDKLRQNMSELDIMTYIIYRERWKYKRTYYTNIWTGLAET